MNESIAEPLIFDLLHWIAEGKERAYEEVMEAWRTSCPRLPVWQDANDRGFLTTDCMSGALHRQSYAGRNGVFGAAEALQSMTGRIISSETLQTRLCA